MALTTVSDRYTEQQIRMYYAEGLWRDRETGLGRITQSCGTSISVRSSTAATASA